MLFDALFRLDNCGVRIVTNVFLSGRIVTVPHVVVTVVALRRDMWIGGVIVDGAVSAVRYRIVTVRILSVDVHVVLLQLVIGIRRSRGHFHLPQRVLRIDASAVV